MRSRQRWVSSVLALLLVTPVAWAETAPETDFSAWVPAGWMLLQEVQGDLNRDGKPDAVLVLQQQDPANIKPNDGLGMPELDLNPRRLLVLLATASGYQQVLATDQFLPSYSSELTPCLADPFEEGGGVGISNRGLLTVNLTYWLSCGSYNVSSYQFKFRHEDGRFRLIGLDGDTFSRSSGEASQVSTNYLTGQRKRVRGLNMFEESSSQEFWEKLDDKPLHFYLDEMISSCFDDKGTQQGWCE